MTSFDSEKNLTPASIILRMHALRQRLPGYKVELLTYGLIAAGSLVLSMPMVNPEISYNARQLLGAQVDLAVGVLMTTALLGTGAAVYTVARRLGTVNGIRSLRQKLLASH